MVLIQLTCQTKRKVVKVPDFPARQNVQLMKCAFISTVPRICSMFCGPLRSQTSKESRVFYTRVHRMAFTLGLEEFWWFLLLWRSLNLTISQLVSAVSFTWFGQTKNHSAGDHNTLAFHKMEKQTRDNPSSPETKSSMSGRANFFVFHVPLLCGRVVRFSSELLSTHTFRWRGIHTALKRQPVEGKWRMGGGGVPRIELLLDYISRNVLHILKSMCGT